MKIGIEAQRIFRKKKHGMDIVALQLIRQLQQVDTPFEFVVFVKDDEDHTAIEETARCRIVRIPSAPYPYWEQVLLPRAARAHGVDLLHCTSNTAPLRLDIPLIVTLHDIIYLEQLNFTQGTWYQIFGNFYRRWNVPQVVKRARQIITVSEYERQRILQHFNLPPATVATVYNGVGENFFPIHDKAQRAAIRAKYKLPDDYIFYLGNTDPKKNLEGVLRALSHLRQNQLLNFQLLMLDIDRGFLENMASRIGDPEILQHISFSGYVPNHDLPAIYSMARLFLYPSLRESFGIPILEAMACGVPVITSNNSSMPEVAGDAALLVNPRQPEDIARAIIHMMDNEPLRKQCIQRGLKRQEDFSWRQNALQTLDLYQTILKHKPALHV